MGHPLCPYYTCLNQKKSDTLWCINRNWSNLLIKFHHQSKHFSFDNNYKCFRLVPLCEFNCMDSRIMYDMLLFCNKVKAKNNPNSVLEMTEFLHFNRFNIFRYHEIDIRHRNEITSLHFNWLKLYCMYRSRKNPFYQFYTRKWNLWFLRMICGDKSHSKL